MTELRTRRLLSSSISSCAEARTRRVSSQFSIVSVSSGRAIALVTSSGSGRRPLRGGAMGHRPGSEPAAGRM